MRSVQSPVQDTQRRGAPAHGSCGQRETRDGASRALARRNDNAVRFPSARADGRTRRSRRVGFASSFNPQYSPNESERRVWQSWAGREGRSRGVQTLRSGAMPVGGVREPFDAVRGVSTGSIGSRRTGPPGAAGGVGAAGGRAVAVRDRPSASCRSSARARPRRARRCWRARASSGGPSAGAARRHAGHARAPMAAGTEMFVAFLSMRVLITVPSRMMRTMSSSARLRAHQASQSTFTLRQARLTTSLARRRPRTARTAHA